MDANELLRQMVIPTPCHQGWNTMCGDERSRFCAACGKHVHNLTAMPSEEVVALIEKSGGDICGRIFERSDGILFLPEEQPALQAPPRPLQFHLRSIMTVIAAVAAALGLARWIPAEMQPPLIQNQPPNLNSVVVGELRVRPAPQSFPVGGARIVDGNMRFRPTLQAPPPTNSTCENTN